MTKHCSFETKIDSLRRFHTSHGNCLVPSNYVDPSIDFKLGKWVGSIRTGRAKISDTQREQLQELGFVWKIRELHDKMTWEEKLEMLQRYKDSHNGDMNVRDGYRDPDSGFNLGQWVSNMRRLKITGKMDAAKERDLANMDFVWGRSLQQRWDDMFQVLIKYRKENPGGAWPRSGFVFKGKQLGNWMQEQRKNYRRKQQRSASQSVPVGRFTMIRDDHERKLKELGFPWNFEAPQKTVKCYMEEPRHVISAQMTAEAAMEYFVQHHLSSAPVITMSDTKPKLMIFAGMLNACDFWSASHFSNKNQATNVVSLPDKSGNKAASSVEQAARAIRQKYNPLLVNQIMSTNYLVLRSEMQMRSVATLLQHYTHMNEIPVVSSSSGELQGILQVQHCLQDLLFVMRNLPTSGATRQPRASCKRGSPSKGSSPPQDVGSDSYHAKKLKTNTHQSDE